MLNKLKSTKFILTSFITISSIILVCCKVITGDQLVSILGIIIPAFFAGNVVASHSSFQGPKSIPQMANEVITDVIDDAKEALKNNLRHGGNDES